MAAEKYAGKILILATESCAYPGADAVGQGPTLVVVGAASADYVSGIHGLNPRIKDGCGSGD